MRKRIHPRNAQLHADFTLVERPIDGVWAIVPVHKLLGVATMGTANVINWVERGIVPDTVVRAGIRQLLRQRLEEIESHHIERSVRRKVEFAERMNRAPIALLPESANAQHYEIPANFFQYVLGGHQKYSACYWRESTNDLDTAERDALDLTCQNAALSDGQDILELGCGWGSLTLWMASHYPNARITAVSNSLSQRRYIESRLQDMGYGNVRVITADMNRFQVDERYDRIVSVEMFEHMRNYARLFTRISSWLKDNGLFFMHIFCHRSDPYEFIDQGPGDWMSRYFFSGGMMPSDDLPLYFQQDLKLKERWRWNGAHYEKTANAWLERLDEHRHELMPVLESTYGSDSASMWLVRWRIFFMSCAELFGYNSGNEWWVSHYLFEKQ